MAPKNDEIRGNTFESIELDALEEASLIFHQVP
jgi:hypothetical protein